MLAIINATVVMRDHYIENGIILCENDKIVRVGKMKEIPVPSGALIFDAKGLYVGPGLIDIHTHAVDKKWIFEHPEETSRSLLNHGVTSVLPALYYNLSKENYLIAIDNILTAYNNGLFPNFSGFYMEGPYLNPNFGCDREKNTWKGEIKREDYVEIIDKAIKHARVWCISPERENIETFVSDVKEKNPDAVFAVAHSEATPEQIHKFIPLGLRIGTHHTNATGTIFKYSEVRGVCVDEVVNYSREIFAELISDKMGLHVDPYMQRLVRRIKGDDRIILISDQFVANGPIPVGYEEATDINFDNAGEIAGSNLTLDVASRNFMMHTGASICDVFNFASYNPAIAVGLKNLGEIREGAIADLIIVDDKFNVKKTILKGELQ